MQKSLAPRPKGHLASYGGGSASLLARLATGVLILGLLALAAYVGITNQLCREIKAGMHSPSAQQSMKLSPARCAQPWWEKL